MIPGKKFSHCKLAFNTCVSLVKQRWETTGWLIVYVLTERWSLT